MYSIDKTGYKQVLLDFHLQIQEGLPLFKNSKVTIDASRVKNILYFGMGGSGITGELLSDVLFDELRVPLNVVRGYLSPAYCSSETLLIVSSYSGNTEETLSALQASADKGAQILAITSGGKLAEMAAEKGWNLIKIPAGLMPRQALGSLFFPLYHMLGTAKLIHNYEKDLTKFIKFIADLNKKNDYPQAGQHVLSLELARTVQGKVPVIYSTAPYLKTISKRWQNQVHENGKSPAFANNLPEMNHNEIVGWESEMEHLDRFIVIFLENENPHPRIQKRIELSKKIIKERGIKVVDIYTCGTTIMEKVFSLIVLGDWMSYFLALAYKKDPATIKNIDFLKQEMTKLSE